MTGGLFIHKKEAWNAQLKDLKKRLKKLPDNLAKQKEEPVLLAKKIHDNIIMCDASHPIFSTINDELKKLKSMVQSLEKPPEIKPKEIVLPKTSSPIDKEKVIVKEKKHKEASFWSMLFCCVPRRKTKEQTEKSSRLSP